MNNKTQLQQELLKKIKLGIKPSDLKKQGKNPSQKENNFVKTESIVKTNEQLLTPPPTPPLKPSQENEEPIPTLTPTSQPAPNSIKPFRCSSCLTTKKSAPIYLKVATTDPQYNLIKGQTYPFCSSCAPKIKEFNEYDLITDDLWLKYPYSSASEILELEFGLKRKERSPWAFDKDKEDQN